MAFWNRRRREKKEQEAAELAEQMRLAQEEFDRMRAQTQKTVSNEGTTLPEAFDDNELIPGDVAESKRLVTECCEAIREIEHQRELATVEYDKVSERLTDIQRIDEISGEAKDTLHDLSKRIMNLTRERNQYKNRSLTITDAQIRLLDPYEEVLGREVKKMYDAEMYQTSINGDIEKLDETKKDLHRQQRQVIANQRTLKKMAKFVILLIISLFVLFAVLYYAMEVDMTYPYLGTILLAAISATVIFAESLRNRTEAALLGKKINKATTLLNRVKIKYINNRSLLDYDRAKFQVKDAAEFEKIWQEYVRAKEYERKFQENTKQLQLVQDQLLELLRDNHVATPDIWLSQTLAIIDPKEMAEVRHALNIRRQKLRERMAENDEAKASMLAGIDRIIAQTPSAERDIIAIVQSYYKES